MWKEVVNKNAFFFFAEGGSNLMEYETGLLDEYAYDPIGLV